MKIKKHMAILGLFMSVNFCSGQMDAAAGKTMLEEFNLKGKIKTVTYEHEKGSHKLYFDENGKLIKQENFPSENEGTITGAIYDNYIYKEGKLHSFDETRVFSSRSNLFIRKVLFEYDSSGLLISSDNSYHNGKTIYKYDEKGNRIERYGYLKTKQNFNSEGRVIEQWAFEDKKTEVREFGVTDGQGNSLPDEIYTLEPYELPPNKYEHNEFGDVISITYLKNFQPVTDTITLVYDDMGNWIERTANGGSSYYSYLTTEDIYTLTFPLHRKHIRRTIEYYE